jgi:hypothetical protein
MPPYHLALASDADYVISNAHLWTVWTSWALADQGRIFEFAYLTSIIFVDVVTRGSALGAQDATFGAYLLAMPDVRYSWHRAFAVWLVPSRLSRSSRGLTFRLQQRDCRSA